MRIIFIIVFVYISIYIYILYIDIDISYIYIYHIYIHIFDIYIYMIYIYMCYICHIYRYIYIYIFMNDYVYCMCCPREDKFASHSRVWLFAMRVRTVENEAVAWVQLPERGHKWLTVHQENANLMNIHKRFQYIIPRYIPILISQFLDDLMENMENILKPAQTHHFHRNSINFEPGHGRPCCHAAVVRSSRHRGRPWTSAPSGAGPPRSCRCRGPTRSWRNCWENGRLKRMGRWSEDHGMVRGDFLWTR